MTKLKRSVTSVCLGASFLILAVSGLYAFFLGYVQINVFVHVLFGWVFLILVTLHLMNNLRLLKGYFKKPVAWVLLLVFTALVLFVFSSFKPVETLKNVYATYKQGLPRAPYEDFYIYKFSDEPNLEIEVLAGKHFWFPQIAIWTEDTVGNYLETLLVTYSTAKGAFYGGRTKDNFSDLDKQSEKKKETIRVDALPYWSHHRGVLYSDGFYTPHPEAQLPDGISGATPQGNFKFRTNLDSLKSFRLLMEVNVAFDDNEYYSEYDFPGDSLYHSGAGLLEQPSLVYGVWIDSDQKYYLMKLIGHGHQSGQKGELFHDLSGITTARKILERVINHFFFKAH